MNNNRVIFTSDIDINDIREEMELESLTEKEAIENLKLEKMYEGKEVISHIFANCNFSAKVLNLKNEEMTLCDTFQKFTEILGYEVWKNLNVEYKDGNLTIEQDGKSDGKFLIFDEDGDVPELD